jgi:hypothetical protein
MFLSSNLPLAVPELWASTCNYVIIVVIVIIVMVTVMVIMIVMMMIMMIMMMMMMAVPELCAFTCVHCDGDGDGDGDDHGDGDGAYPLKQNRAHMFSVR